MVNVFHVMDCVQRFANSLTLFTRATSRTSATAPCWREASPYSTQPSMGSSRSIRTSPSVLATLSWILIVWRCSAL